MLLPNLRQEKIRKKAAPYTFMKQVVLGSSSGIPTNQTYTAELENRGSEYLMPQNVLSNTITGDHSK